ncbi:MAG: beta-galactosidase, partial [Acidobacteria bacterium]|nr:beta-galactosidase [Acidobacteriota bacterium]
MFKSLWIRHASSTRRAQWRAGAHRPLLACCLASLLAGGRCLAGEIVLPSPALERDEPIRVVYRTGALATGKGEISVRWTDVYGRVIEDRKIPFELTDESEVGFTLDLRRAVAMRNELSAHFSFQGIDKKGTRDHREEDARISFVARPPDRAWWDYAIIMWQQHSAPTFAVLKKLGISAGQYSGKAKTPPEFLLKNDLRWYGENIATDFYSEYHRWFPDRPVNWKFRGARELYKKDPSSQEAFKRHPSLSDPEWLGKIHDRLVESARVNSPYRPLFYDLGDEAGIADLAAFWDFDFSDHSLTEMRRWLKERYGTLAALNAQWGADFTAWELVTPMTTAQAMKRSDNNFSSWADFKEWMDISFARAVKMGVDAVRSVDPEAYVAIAGAQLPGWGGYDFARLSKVLNAIEPYDYGANVE